VLGKFLAAVSPIPVALVITVPYLAVLSQGDPMFWPATFWLFVFGHLFVPALAAIGMLTSIWFGTTRTSLLVALAIYLIMLIPSQMLRPGMVVTVSEARRALMIQAIDPVDAMVKFFGYVVVLGARPADHWGLMVTPALVGTAILVLLFAVATRRIGLEPATGGRWRTLWGRASRPAGARPLPQAVAPTAPPAPDPGPVDQGLAVQSAAPRRAAGPPPAERGLAPSPVAAWWLVLKRELRNLWIGGRALNLSVGYAVLLGAYSYWLVQDSTQSLIPPKEMVFELVKIAMIFSVFMSVVIAADSLSGERDRATLETMLHTPVSRRQIVVGKFLAAASTWPVALLITLPYLYVLAQGDEVFGQAARWSAILGTVLTPAFAALAVLVSFWSNNNKTSMFVNIALYLMFLLPTQLPGHAQGGSMGLLFQALNPLAGTRHFLAGILVNNRTPAEYGWFLWSSGVFFVAVLVLLFWYAAPALGLDGGRTARWPRAGAALAAVFACLFGLVGSTAAQAPGEPPQAAAIPAPAAALQVAIDKSDTIVRAGLPLLFNTDVSNTGADASPAIIVAMNIINLNRHGEVVDPEDWSPQRTQYVEPLAPGQSTTLAWRVNAILDGDFMVYMVAIPAPAGPEATSHPVASAGIHLTVTPYTKLNPGGVLPYAFGGPLLLGLIIFLVYRHRRRQIDMGEAPAAE
jgi:ABC-2 type transport system permease protein